jgi:Fe-S-cluster containining protein
MKRAKVSLQGAGFRLEFQVAVPAGATTPGALLPLARALSDAIVGETRRTVEAAGATISCSKGCAACCRSLVAVSAIEAREIRELVAALPEPRRAVVQARFDQARHRLAEAGLLHKLEDAPAWSEADYKAMATAYFALAISCPFLEQEACTIYEDRPLACREFMVTTPPRHCAELTSDHVRRVRLPLRVFNAVARWQAPPQGLVMEHWVPLILAPDWPQAQGPEPLPKPGMELLRELLDGLREAS